MNRWVGVGVVVALLIVAFVGFERPDLFPGDVDVPRLVWLLMALLLVAGGLFGFGRARIDGGQVLTAIAVWGALIVAITFAYSWFN